jgi:hypothetical protein
MSPQSGAGANRGEPEAMAIDRCWTCGNSPTVSKNKKEHVLFIHFIS